MGRITKYSDTLADSLIDWLTSGKLQIDWCRENNIDRSTVFRWREANPEFAQRFARAMDCRDDILEEEAIKVADEKDFSINTETDSVSAKTGNTHSVTKSDNVARSKLMVETRLKIIDRRKGQKIKLQGDKENPLNVSVSAPEGLLSIYKRMKEDA